MTLALYRAIICYCWFIWIPWFLKYFWHSCSAKYFLAVEELILFSLDFLPLLCDFLRKVHFFPFFFPWLLYYTFYRNIKYHTDYEPLVSKMHFAYSKELAIFFSSLYGVALIPGRDATVARIYHNCYASIRYFFWIYWEFFFCL